MIFYFPIKALRAASPKYQLNLEIAKKSNFSKLTQNEALRPLVTKTIFKLDESKTIFFTQFFRFNAPNR